MLEAIGGAVLRPELVNAVIAQALEALKPEAAAREEQSIQRDLVAVERELERLTQAVAQGGSLETLIAALQERQRRKRELTVALEHVQSRTLKLDQNWIERETRKRLEDWRGLLLGRHVAQSRQMPRKMIAGPIVFTPVIEGKTRGYTFEGQAPLGKLRTGIVDLPTNLASPTGFDGFGQRRSRRL